jgi:Zn-dependent M28 family amino/carboxypeptidase
VERYTLEAWADRVRIPAVEISPALAESLVRGTGRSLPELGRAAEEAGSFPPLALPGLTVDLRVSVDRRVVSDRNVVAALEGADASLKDEWVVIGAHFDHEGADGSRIYNGADDDGSGIVALLSIADAFAGEAREGRRPRRSLVFAAWNSEERGLLGSWAFTESPPMPLDRVVAALNMDMIGRNEEVPSDGGNRFLGLEPQSAESNRNAVNVLGATRSEDLRAVAERANAGVSLLLRFRYDNNQSQLMRRSDHWPFLQHGIPALWLHTGLHPDYHTERDRPEKINYEKLEKVARLAYQMTSELANQPGRPRLQGAGVRGTR